MEQATNNTIIRWVFVRGGFSPNGDVEPFKTNVGLWLLFGHPGLGFDVFGDAAQDH